MIERAKGSAAKRDYRRALQATLIWTAAMLLLFATIVVVNAQETAAGDAEEERSSGLPERGDWTFNLDAGVGGFGFNNSLYTNERPDPSGDLSDDWIESYIKPALSGDFKLENTSAFYGKVSAVGARTFSAPPTLVGEDASSFDIEDLYVGWRSGTAFGSSEDALDIKLGRAPYTIGHGFLLWDGAGDGGSRGGFWSGPRQAWEKAGVGRLDTKHNDFEVFYVDRDELPENDTDNRIWGGNYELTLGEEDAFILGLTYLKAESDIALRDGMDVYNGRIFTAPFGSLPGLSFEVEYAFEDNEDLVEASGWAAQVGYKMVQIGWTPQLSYRYAYFQGDDPATAESEAFDPLFPGFYDWGTWWQGEIGGEYFLANSNLISHQVRLGLTPSDSLSTGLIGYAFQLDQPATFAPGVTSDEVLVEVDLYVDWQINGNFTASFVLAYAEPREAIEQGFGRTQTLSYGMAYLSYSY